MSDTDSGGGEDLSGLSGFFFYVFIVHPCTAWILRPGRFERKKSIMYAIAFLGAIAAIKTGQSSGSRSLHEYTKKASRHGFLVFVCFCPCCFGLSWHKKGLLLQSGAFGSRVVYRRSHESENERYIHLAFSSF